MPIDKRFHVFGQGDRQGCHGTNLRTYTFNQGDSMRKVGIGLLIVSFVPWGLAFAIPFMALPLSQKAAIAAALFIVAEVMFWIGVLIVGKEVADRYRQWLNPRFIWSRMRRGKR